MYKEILELEKYCNEIGVECKGEKHFDGYVLRFNNGGDVIQCTGSYGSRHGCVEFGYTGYEGMDFKACTLENAKAFVELAKDKLNEVTENETNI